MSIFNKIILCLLLLFPIPMTALAFGGSGDFSINYLYLDDEGNRSVYQPAFNIYEGLGISLENFHYALKNGLMFSADLKNIILNNRNLKMGVGKPGLFGVGFRHNQYRRIYNFGGASYTRRHVNGGKVWINPHRYLKFWGGANYAERSGSVADLAGLDLSAFRADVDYSQFEYSGGFRFNYLGRMLGAEYRFSDFSDNVDPVRDQSRRDFKIIALFPIPGYQWLVLSGGFRNFENRYDLTDYKISSNRGWGGFLADLPENFQLRYHFIFDRTGSDSDYVATDNIAHAVYLNHLWPRLAQLAIGYQHDIKDDFEDEIAADSYYISGWLKPIPKLELRADFGLNEEEVKEGARLAGNEDRSRYRFSGKYRNKKLGSIAIKIEDKIRRNDDLDSRIDFLHYVLDYSISIDKYGMFSGSYAVSSGDYENRERCFEFTDQTISADILLAENHNFTPGFALTYYRSKRDLDVESFSLRFNLAYRFYSDYRIQLNYNVFNFDDYLVVDRYYTVNIVEINLIKNISF